MSEIENTIEVDPITPIHEGECPSLSGRSILTYAIGRHAKEATLHLRIVRNSGGGMSCTDWADSSQIEAIVKGGSELTAKSFQVLHPGKSINTGGFLLAVLKDLGLLRANAENTRLHEHIPTTTFEQVAMARVAQPIEQEPKPGRRKAKEG